MKRRLQVMAGILWFVAQNPALAGDAISYDRQIRPILSKVCYPCHGPDPATRKAKLRLDTRSDAVADRDGLFAIVPGEPDRSELLKRVSSSDPDFRMPPPKEGAALPEGDIALIREWVAQGAPWSTHWAFVPPQRPTVPIPTDRTWSKNPVDSFVLERLEEEGLKPSPEADRETLLRRLNLDLTGLLPSVDEIDRVLADDSAGWYEALVERLLSSQHYGERWARHWMDAAQYADSDGFEKDKPRFVWAWRDWLIQAFNTNMPYDRFVTEQVAGDMLPNATQDQAVATGFLRNSMINEEGGIDPEQFRMEAQFNRMDIIGRAVLGLTVQCAQCHSHKYDPLTQTEYYSMLAFLNNEHEACVTVYSPFEQKQRASILALTDEIEEDVKKANPDWRERMAAWEATMNALPRPNWEILSFVFDDTSAGGQKCNPQGDGSYLAEGYAPTQFYPKMTTTTTLPRITAVRLELLPDPNLPRGGPGRSIYGACALSEFEVRIAPADTPIADYDKWTLVKFASAIADVNPAQRQLGTEFPDKQSHQRVTGPVDMAIDGKPETAWSTDNNPEQRNKAHVAIFKLAEPLIIAPGMTLAFRPAQLHGGWNSDDNQNNNLGRFRFSVTDADALPDHVLSPKVLEALAAPPASRSEVENHELFALWRSSMPELGEANARIDALLQALPQGTTQLALKEREAPRTTHRLERGDFLRPAEEVKPGVPAFMHPLKTDAAPNRLDFARWLVARDSPTTARAFVNRAWQEYFGQGLESTSSDLGTQGEAPSYPELLDWIAVEFMNTGWDVKHLHRLIVTSATYRQASRVSSDLLERDPYNRLLARGARFRVDGEIVRDVALAASGLLNPAVGGPSVYPPAPEFLFKPPASYGPKTWRMDQGAAQYRRGMYTFRFRSVPYPVLQAFDTPPGDAPCTLRVRSNTPMQALTTLNEPLFFDCAEALARVSLAEGGVTNESRIEYAFRRCTTRRPELAEIEMLTQFLEKQQARVAAGELVPKDVLGEANTAVTDDENSAELAAWTLVARVLLNLDETITRE